MLQKLRLESCNLIDDFLDKLLDAIPYLTTLDLSGNTMISNNGYTALSERIDKAHQTGESMLKELILRNCNLTDDNLLKLLDAIPYLTTLDLSGNIMISNNGYTALSERIGKAHQTGESMLKELILYDCDILDKDIDRLSSCNVSVKF